ncbi:MAG: hypothetical protein K6E67_07275 [Prevotella sp.]|jgi:hypothetical protein|nr:hypothetical protein [Prevotella sp.]
MKNVFFSFAITAIASVAMASCGNKTTANGGTADSVNSESTVVATAADTTASAVLAEDGAAADGKGLDEEWDVSVRTFDMDSEPKYEVIIRDSEGKTRTVGERTGFDYPQDMLETFGNVWETDVNFDGHTDVLICLGRMPASDQTFVHYDAWVYDPDDGKFYCQGTFRDIFNPEIDREEHRILSHYIARDGVTRVYSAHYWQKDGNIVTVGDSWTVSPDK